MSDSVRSEPCQWPVGANDRRCGEPSVGRTTVTWMGASPPLDDIPVCREHLDEETYGPKGTAPASP